ncbi:MAG: MerR family transcriptional regulator [Gemmatimonadales bacterium]|nr:MerR family transcriptional regulator [Gemmatimonadales bacterium]NIN50698.1 MerR family transcriptional regulator [Gemmatimonadales bacterium]NIP08162.1 MerR family transcriptional regulator [Gemmatimonadales bacterium]NIR01040.1 MerR family transcriptional regulator [Gemmatimonadales bacterium]NIS65119.1 MerR family transcriptional regulator [Gemmatimonadales bacterium]
MSDTALYTLRDIARQLNLPESTVRYYRDAFAEHVATVGTGRRRRYPVEAVAVLRSIADGYSAGKTREEIDAELFGGPVPIRARPRPRSQATGDELLATILDGERERREAMWQMAREIVRLGEAIERQQVVLGDIAEQLGTPTDRTLTPGPTPPADPAPQEAAQLPPIGVTTEELGASPAAASGGHAKLVGELESLRAQLATERELVERLRKSKLEIERRAVEAEARLEDRPPGIRRVPMFRRFLSGDSEGGV